jgi:hypothetical protein
MSLRVTVLARLASYSQHGSDTTYHTPFRDSGNEASIRVPLGLQKNYINAAAIYASTNTQILQVGSFKHREQLYILDQLQIPSGFED